MDGVEARLPTAARPTLVRGALGWPVYQPPAFFWWWFAYDAYARDDLRRGRLHRGFRRYRCDRRSHHHVGMAGARDQEVTTYGSARWAETVNPSRRPAHADGVLLGRWRGAYLRHDGPEHVLCFAPTRSGKGVGLVVPTLLTWPGSAIVHDIKGENWTLTAGWRARFGRVPAVRSDQCAAPHTIRCWKCAAATGKCATCRTSPTCWSIPKARWSAATTGRRPATRCWSAPSCTCFTPRRTRRCAASPTSCPIRSARSSRPCAR